MNTVPRIACFFHEKERSYFEELCNHFTALKIPVWSRDQIQAGAVGESVTEQHLQQDELLLFLLSPDLLASDECMAWIESARRRHESGEARAILIRVHPCVSQEVPQLRSFPTLPRDGEPLSSLRPSARRTELLNIVTRIHALSSPAQPSVQKEGAKPGRVWKRWLPGPAICALAAAAYFIFRPEPKIREWQDGQKRYNYEVMGISGCEDCSGRINGGAETPRWKCGKSYIFPPQELIPASLIFYCGTKTYEVNFNTTPIQLKPAEGN